MCSILHVAHVRVRRVTPVIDELHENPLIDAIILLVEFGVLLRLELLEVRDDQFSRSTLRQSFVSVH